MKAMVKRFIKLIVGLAVLAFGIAMSYSANLGMAPWDVLNDGFSKVLPISFGAASIILGLVILVFDLLLKERVGFGTFLNILLIGSIFDLIVAAGVLPSYLSCISYEEQLAPRLVMCILSLIPTSLGLYLYMSAAFGAGPRDSLMCAVTKRLPIPVGAVRMVIEGCALLAGWLMGGTVGIGTIILVLGNGPVMQLVFRIFRFDVKTLHNETIPETLRSLKKLCKKGNDLGIEK